MADMNSVITRNILLAMKKRNRTQSDLAKELNYSNQTVKNMLNGSRVISAVELSQISKYLGVGMSALTKVPNYSVDSMSGVFSELMETADEEKDAGCLNELINLAIFQRRLRNHLKSARKWVK